MRDKILPICRFIQILFCWQCKQTTSHFLYNKVAPMPGLLRIYWLIWALLCTLVSSVSYLRKNEHPSAFMLASTQAQMRTYMDTYHAFTHAFSQMDTWEGNRTQTRGYTHMLTHAHIHTCVHAWMQLLVRAHA